MPLPRALSFGAVAELYDASRPSPPPGLADVLGPLDDCKVLEIGAGTGLMTRFLVSLGARVSAVEPDDAMRMVLERRSPGVRAWRASAGSLPFHDGAFDDVIVCS